MGAYVCRTWDIYYVEFGVPPAGVFEFAGDIDDAVTQVVSAVVRC